MGPGERGSDITRTGIESLGSFAQIQSPSPDNGLILPINHEPESLQIWPTLCDAWSSSSYHGRASIIRSVVHTLYMYSMLSMYLEYWSALDLVLISLQEARDIFPNGEMGLSLASDWLCHELDSRSSTLHALHHFREKIA